MSAQQEIIKAAQSLHSNQLGTGTSGNVSARSTSGFYITPSGVPYEELKPQMIVELDSDGQTIGGKLLPSSEWRFHRDIYQHRSDVHAIVHTHSPFATAIACTRQDIPAFHYVVAIAGGSSIRCAEYATFGTQELSDHALQALQDRKACLLANHGVIATGADVPAALAMAIEVEELAKQYVLSQQTGNPVLLDDEEMAINLEKFRTYGKQKPGED